MSTLSVFVDGGPFFDGLHAQGFSTDLYFRRLMACLAGCPVETIGEVHFYMARLPEGPYPNKSAAQLAYFDRLGGEGVKVVQGTTEVRGGQFIERDVEAALTADLVMGAWSRRYEEALLVSRRAAFVPAVRAAAVAGCRIRTAFFRYRIDPVDGLAAVASATRAITAEDIVKCTRHGPVPRGVHAVGA
jgi:hypothetical protein